ncbi:hypothetical protein BV898_13629 [Hypsibius exemplaris]|uniref:Uncharacterized protein n=1 Tax=Hypsibius exemplaris TaxID=2072580 RepID=A0A1W0WA32_HYPEX|nr:hypothetical protein BV898_13629 [Hypsibius exemplaris]
MNPNMMVICSVFLLTLSVLFVEADVAAEVNRQINDAKDRINAGLANVQTNIANAPSGSSVSVSCTSDANGSNCVKTTNTGTGGSVVAPAVIRTVDTNNQPAVVVPISGNNQVIRGSGSVLSSSMALMLALAALISYLI